MKKTNYFFIILALTLLITNAFGQKPAITLTFNAQYESQSVPLERVYIENLTQGGDTTLYAPNTSLVLNYSLGIEDMMGAGNNALTIAQNYPNPFTEQTSVSIFMPNADQLQVSVTNLLGQRVAFYENSLAAGIHSFVFNPGADKYYILTATANGMVRAIKMVSLSKHAQKAGSLVYLGSEEVQVEYKSTQDINGFGYSLGDQLRYTGIAKSPSEITGSDVILDTPGNNKTYQFEITNGIPCIGEPTVIYEGKQYNTVLIGSRCWFKENLNVGTRIDGVDEMLENGLLEKYCYDDSEDNCDTYGGLYQWNEMMQYTTTEGAQGICPTGWHIPTYAEWTSLGAFLEGNGIAGGKMKEVGNDHWAAPNTGATNESGFTGLPAGYRAPNTLAFVDKGYLGHFWGSTSNSTNAIWCRLRYNDDNLDPDDHIKEMSFSVRCVRDVEIPCGGVPTVTDVDGNVYNTVTIGNQCWLKENLKTRKYRNNTNIPYVADWEDWHNLTTGAYVWYDLDITWKEPYGALYNWYATVDANGLCPTGWHVPSDDEWTALTDFIGGTGSPHGNELKSCRQVNSPLGGDCNTSEHPRWDEDANYGNYGTNDYGFSGLPGGYLLFGDFQDVGATEEGWLSTDYSSNNAWHYIIGSSSGEVAVYNNPKHFGLSVRCLRNN